MARQKGFNPRCITDRKLFGVADPPAGLYPQWESVKVGLGRYMGSGPDATSGCPMYADSTPEAGRLGVMVCPGCARGVPSKVVS